MNKKHYILLSALVASGFLASCSDDEADTQKYYNVELIMGMNEQEDGGLITRALPDGYATFDPDENPGQIGVFMTQKQAGGTSFTYSTISGSYTWKQKGQWNSTVTIRYDKDHPEETDNDYWVYGFMPVGGGISASITSSDFEAGAVMSLTNVPPVSAEDVCIITAAKNATPKSGGGYEDITDIDWKNTFKYKYYFEGSDQNALYLLMDHLYSRYILTMKVDAGYNAMRTIKVKNMSMTASAPAVNITVTYQQGQAPEKNLSASAETTPVSSEILDSEEGEELNTDTKTLTEFYCANFIDFITLTTTFDVYDKAGNLLREGCQTENSIKVQNLEPGKKYTIVATVKPTYLYQLSDPDLDQPTIVTE